LKKKNPAFFHTIFFIPLATIMASLEDKDTAAADGDPLDPYSRAFDPLAALESADPIPFMRAHPSARPMDNLARIARLMAPELIGTDWRVTGYGGEREGGAMQCVSAILFFFLFCFVFLCLRSIGVFLHHNSKYILDISTHPLPQQAARPAGRGRGRRCAGTHASRWRAAGHRQGRRVGAAVVFE
jgi:hypothetical protein